jgi:hypothetical protein
MAFQEPKVLAATDTGAKFLRDDDAQVLKRREPGVESLQGRLLRDRGGRR